MRAGKRMPGRSSKVCQASRAASWGQLQEVGRRLHEAAEEALPRRAQEELARGLLGEVLGEDRRQLLRVAGARLARREARVGQAVVAEELGEAVGGDEAARLQRHPAVGGGQRLARERVAARRPAALDAAHERVAAPR